METDMGVGVTNGISKDKALPAGITEPDAAGAFNAGIRVGDLWTPALVLAQDRLEHNAAFMVHWCSSQGLELMPHGKTTMTPSLWDLQLRAGATGLTVATPWQLRIAVDHGVKAVQLANQLTDPSAIRWLAQQSTSPTAPTVWSWIDDPRVVEGTTRILSEIPDAQPLNVLIDLGRTGARTGARTIEQAVAVAQAVAHSPKLRLAGVAGYEGAIADGRSEASERLIRQYVNDLIALHDRLATLYECETPLVTAGGSAYPDLVADVFHRARMNPKLRKTRYVLRSGAYLIHDDGYYHQRSPFDGKGLLPAARGVTRIISQPEPGLALLDGGKRDFPYDEGLPASLYAVRIGSNKPVRLTDTTITGMNDQHSFLRYDTAMDLAPGDLVVLGLSHPCTMFDKWHRIPVVDSFSPDTDGPNIDSIITRLITTCF